MGLGVSWSGRPALGPLLSPFEGLWQNYPRSRPLEKHFVDLKKDTQVFWDEYGVPHIQAKTEEDLYWAQGYLVASDRLFQMDLQTRAAAGRLSELMGLKTLSVDKMFVKMGLRRAARGALTAMLSEPMTKTALMAYTAGVNRYIEEIRQGAQELPVEYKLIGAEPEDWEPIRTAYLLKMMSFRLNGHSQDLNLTRYLKELGKDKVEDLFPDRFAGDIPVVNDFKADQKPLKVPEEDQAFVSSFDEWPEYLKPYLGNGSNNWAVAPQKSATGHSLLANDTHLKYALPAVWYEMQLMGPEVNVYGATFPGAPGVIIGFNEKVAWGVTNAYSDVLDWYEVEFKDSGFSHYRVGEDWLPAEKEQQMILVKGAEPVEVELVWTRYGVVVHSQNQKALTYRWVSHQPSNELLSFLKLNRAQDHKACLEAISNYQAPAQNFICADADNIAIRHQGRYPKKWQGQGKYVLDGSRAESNWQGWIEPDLIPQAVNPEPGYVLSANQRPIEKGYPYYLGWEHIESYRSQRIQEVLSQSKSLAPEDLIKLQNDNLNKHAELILPVLLKVFEQGDKSTIETVSESLQEQALAALKQWDFVESNAQVAPTLFHAWWKNLEEAIWSDELGPRKTSVYPKPPRTTALLREALSDSRKKSQSAWIDDQSTPDVVESVREVVQGSLTKALKELKERHGSSLKDWKWGQVRPSKLPHFAGIHGLGSAALDLPGSAHSVNANRGDHGATWKMVVALGPDMKAWTNYPGGPSGHPFDPEYMSYVKSWSQGHMRPVHFLRPDTDSHESIQHTSHLRAQESPSQ